MTIGARRHRVVLQQTTETRDASGAVVDTWGRIADAYVAIEPLGGRELETARQVYGEVSYRLEGTYVDLAAARPKMRVVKGPIDASTGIPGTGARVFEIEGAINVGERSKDVHLFVREHQ